MFLAVYIILFVFFIFLFVFFIADVVLLSKQRKCQAEINNVTKDYLQKNNFEYDKVFYLEDRSSVDRQILEKQTIYVDTKDKKIAFTDYDAGSVCIVSFEDVLDYEVYRNGSTITTGAKFGGFGALFGAESAGNCKQLKLIIKIKEYSKPHIIYTFIDNPNLGLIGLSETSRVYQSCVKSIQEISAFLEILKNENKK